MNLCATATEQNDKNKRAPGMKSQSVFDSNDYYVFRWKSFVVRRLVPFGMSCRSIEIFFLVRKRIVFGLSGTAHFQLI